MKRSEAVAYRAKIETAAEEQNDEMALESIELFPKWKAGVEVIVGKRFSHIGKLWRVDQTHVTQSDWEPQNTPALWTEVTLEEWPEWVRPISAETAYKVGDKVTYNGQHYMSVIDGNTWSPDEYPAGWSIA